jgi:predicted outer membrane protein
MLTSLALVMLLAETPAGTTTLPRHREQQATRTEQPTAQPGEPADHKPGQPAGNSGDRPFESADPLFDRPLTATDDPAFVLSVVENGRQGVMDAKAAESGLSTPELRAAAARIEQQHQATLDKIEALAKAKGWRLPQGNPGRTGTVPVNSAARTDASFIINQIAFHQQTLDQFRAQAAGKGDPQLRRVLRDAVPGYQKNLELLLGLKL